jgi:hypothetical protein
MFRRSRCITASDSDGSAHLGSCLLAASRGEPDPAIRSSRPAQVTQTEQGNRGEAGGEGESPARAQGGAGVLCAQCCSGGAPPCARRGAAETVHIAPKPKGAKRKTDRSKKEGKRGQKKGARVFRPLGAGRREANLQELFVLFVLDSRQRTPDRASQQKPELRPTPPTRARARAGPSWPPPQTWRRYTFCAPP